MKTTKTNPKETARSAGRVSAIAAAIIIGTVGLMGAEPVIGIAGWYAAWLLYNRWRETDKWLTAYEKNLDKELGITHNNTMSIGKEAEKK